MAAPKKKPTEKSARAKITTHPGTKVKSTGAQVANGRNMLARDGKKLTNSNTPAKSRARSTPRRQGRS